MAPGGVLRQYLQESQLAYVVGDALFVHGGLIGGFKSARAPDEAATDCLGYIPGRPGRIRDVREWVAALNAWSAQQVDAWVAQPGWEIPLTASAARTRPKQVTRQKSLREMKTVIGGGHGGGDGGADSADGPGGTGGGGGSAGGGAGADARGQRRDRGGDALMDYCVPTSEPSVVMGRHLDSDSMPMQLPRELAAVLAEQGIFRVFLGHTPHGNCPTVIPTPVDDREGGGPQTVVCIMADTSYSDMSAPDNRGRAVSEVVAHIGVEGSRQVRVHGCTETGQRLEYVLSPDPATLCHVGQREPDSDRAVGRFVKAQLEGSDDFLLCLVKGFSTTYATVNSVELQKLLHPLACDGEDIEQLGQDVERRSEEQFHGFHADDSEEIWAKYRNRLWKEMFSQVDRDGNGTVSFDELNNAVLDRRKPWLRSLLFPRLNKVTCPQLSTRCRSSSSLCA